MRRMLAAVALVVLLVTWGLTAIALYGSHRLPASIPTHFDAAGHANGWGSPATLWLFPAIASFIFALMTVVARYPSAFNYPVIVTVQNKARLQDLALNMIAFLNAELVCLFASIQYLVIRFAREGRGSLSPAFLPVVIAMILGTVIWHIAAMVRSAPVRSSR